MPEKGPCSVLVVEAPSTRIQDTLARCHHLSLEVASVSTLVEALAHIGRERPSLVMLDLERPDAGQLGDLESLLGLAPDLAVVLVTGEDNTGLADAAVALGAQDCLVRTHLNPGMLGRVAQHAVERQRLTSGLRAAVERLHRSESHLRESRGRLSAILGAVPLAVLHLDALGHVLMVSRLPGFAAAGVAPGTGLSELLPLQAGTRLQWHLHQAVLHKAEQRFELVAPGAEGRPGTWVVHLTPILGTNGDVASITATFRDVTEDRLISDRLAQSDRMATVGILAASLTAEINNPMTAVIANAQALQEALQQAAEAARAGTVGEPQWLLDLESEIPEMADDMAVGAGRVQRIVMDLHRYAEVRERFEVVIDPSQALRAAIALAGPELGADVTVMTQLASTPPVRVDESRFTQVIAELLSNAARVMGHLPSGDQRIEVGLAAAGGSMLLTVRDHGPGVPAENRTRIFEPSFARQTGDGATGVGLAVARRMVSAWGGQLTVEDHPDGGALFSVVLPQARAGEAARTRRARERQGHAATPVPLRGRIVLLARDPARTERLRRALSVDHQVVVVGDVDAAQVTLRGPAPTAAVLIDLASAPDALVAFEAWLTMNTPQLCGRVAWVAPNAPTEAQTHALAGRSGRVVDADAGPEALRRVMGRLLAA